MIFGILVFSVMWLQAPDDDDEDCFLKRYFRGRCLAPVHVKLPSSTRSPPNLTASQMYDGWLGCFGCTMIDCVVVVGTKARQSWPQQVYASLRSTMAATPAVDVAAGVGDYYRQYRPPIVTFKTSCMYSLRWMSREDDENKLAFCRGESSC